jgi:hypothetical protein
VAPTPKKAKRRKVKQVLYLLRFSKPLPLFHLLRKFVASDLKKPKKIPTRMTIVAVVADVEAVAAAVLNVRSAQNRA